MVDQVREIYDNSHLNLDVIPRLPERPDSLENQLKDVVLMCNQAGAWKAADFIADVLKQELYKLVK